MLPVVEVGDDFLDHRTRERAAVVGFAGLPLGVDRRDVSAACTVCQMRRGYDYVVIVFIPDSPFAIRFAYSLLFVVTFFVS